VPFQCLLHEGQSCLFIPLLRNVALQNFPFLIDGALEQQVLDVPQRQRVTDIYHHHQPDHLWGGVEIPKRTNGGLGHDPSFTEPRFALTAPSPAFLVVALTAPTNEVPLVGFLWGAMWDDESAHMRNVQIQHDIEYLGGLYSASFGHLLRTPIM